MRLLIMLLFFNFVNCDIWPNFHITWSLHNHFEKLPQLENAVKSWKIRPFEFENSNYGNIRVYFTNISSSQILGYAWKPPNGLIHIREDLEPIFLKSVFQHEFGHALGLSHSYSNETNMFVYFNNKKVTQEDRKQLRKAYKCLFDSVSLINNKTFFIFKGSYFKRLDVDFNTKETSKNWISNIKKVDTFYRNQTTGHYIMISNEIFYELNMRLQFLKKGLTSWLFPSIRTVNSVLPYKNNVYVFYNNSLYLNGFKYKDIFKLSPNSKIRGSYITADENIALIDDNQISIYSKAFNFIKNLAFCDITPKILCCKT